MKGLLLFLILGVYSQARAQYGNDAKNLADKAFSNNKFYEAAYYYKKVAEEMRLTGTGEIPYQPDNGTDRKNSAGSVNKEYIIFRLAESYRLYENYVEAEGWYFKLLNQNQNISYPLSRLWFGVCLRANQRFDEAIKQMEIFTQSYKGDNKYTTIALKEIANCRYAKEQYQYPALLIVTKLKGQFNSDGSNYAIASVGTSTWFTSSRSVKEDRKRLNKIYQLIAADANPVAVDLKFTDNRKDNEYGTVCFNSAGNRMYFTRWFKDGTKSIHAVYSCTRTSDGWSAPRKLNVNVNADGFNTIQPYICANDKLLFFASDKPGGQGGYDIWMSNLDDNGNPVDSFNLGNSVNTLFDEQAPYYDSIKQRLLYSSKGFTGLGGFDFFESFGSADKWSKPLNMGFPFNSAKDDLYYRPNPANAAEFYISSDRESDCCLDLFEVKNKSYTIVGKVIDCDTHQLLSGVEVILTDSLTKHVVAKALLSANGKYAFKIADKRPSTLTIEKAGYLIKVTSASFSGSVQNDTLFSQQACLQKINIGKPVILSNILYDFGQSALRPQSYPVLDEVVKLLDSSPTMKIEMGAHTDDIGSDNLNLKLSQARAQSCVNYIISKGVSKLRVVAKGYGESKPVAPNSFPDGKDNPEGRQLNRRTELTVLR